MRNRPDVDWESTLVGDDGLGLSESHKGAQGKGTARHDAGKTENRARYQRIEWMSGNRDDERRIIGQLNGCWMNGVKKRWWIGGAEAIL